MTGKKPIPDDEVEGEGSYAATERYNEETAKAAQDKDEISEAADAAAAAIDGEEGEELDQAAAEAKSHAHE